MSSRHQTRIDASADLAYADLLLQGHFLPDPAEWHGICRSLLVRHLRERQPLDKLIKDLVLNKTTARHIISVGRCLFESSCESPHVATAALFPRDHNINLRANAIGRAMYLVWRQGLCARFFVRSVVLQYAARERNKRMLTIDLPHRGIRGDDGYARTLEETKSLVGLIASLGMKDVMIRLVSFDDDPEGAASVRKVGVKLRLPDVPPREYSPRRGRPRSSIPQIGVEVVRRIAKDKYVFEPAFRAAMLLADVVEPWNFSRPPTHRADLLF